MPAAALSPSELPNKSSRAPNLSLGSFFISQAYSPLIRSLCVRALVILFVILFLSSPALIGAPKCSDLPMQHGNYANGARTAEHKDLTVVSLNMAKEKVHDKILRDLRKTPFFETADIWLFQEAMKTIPEIARTMGLNYVYAPTEDSGLAILSRYPIGNPERIPLSQHNVIFRSRCRIALSAKIQSLEVVNVHLDNRIGKQQRLDQASPLLNGERVI